MKSFFKFAEKNSKKSGKLTVVFLLILMSFSFLFTPVKPAQAQLVTVAPTTVVGDALKWAWDKTSQAFDYLWKKGGSLAFQQTLRTVLNTVAVDTAKYVGSGMSGQKPLFITSPWTYVGDLGDEAAGAYLENFANNMAASNNCDSKTTACVNNCSKTGYDACAANCRATVGTTCNSCASQKIACKNNCDVKYRSDVTSIVNDQVTGLSDVNRSDAKQLADNRPACYSNCDKAVCKDSTGAVISSGNTSTLSTPAFNVCQPSSIDAKLKITLGIADQTRPQGSDCKGTDIVKNWGNLDNYGNSVQALKDLYNTTQGGYNDQVFLNDIKSIFSPSGNDIGIYLTTKVGSSNVVSAKQTAATNMLVGKGGWLDAQDIAGNTKSIPNQAQISTQASYNAYASNFGKSTGDAFVDAANTFLSQTAFTAFSTLMQNLGHTSTQGNNTNTDLTSSSATGSGGGTGENAIVEAAAKLNQPDYSSKANYDILSQLTMCPNADNPGPTDCVIDNKFMQAIAEHKTVMESLNDGSLDGTWQLTKDNLANAYTLRNISILRKYLILPVGWEVAIQKASDKNLTTVTLNDLISCFDQNGSYKKFSSSFNQQDQDWCRGLVDPNWVLKAPLNSCNKLGIGGQITDFTVNPGFAGVSGSPDILSSYNVTRADNYCADPQTCIKEKNDGTCEAYGYCSEEKRTWNFGSDSCSPVNNTCQTFTGGENSKTVSYLKNTLDYTSCNASSAGCKQYSLTGDYNSASDAVTWDPAKSIFFNGSQLFSNCDQTSEGCTGLLRVKSTDGNNLVINSDFSADTVGDTIIKGNALNSWPLIGSGDSWQATIVDANSDPTVDARSLKLEASGPSGTNVMAGVYSDTGASMVPDNLQIIPGQAYTLSADVYLVNGDKAQATIGFGDNIIYNEITTQNSWQHISVTRSPMNSFNRPAFFIKGYSNNGGQVTFYVKNINFTASNLDNGYSAYGASKIYEKLLPNYLEQACYVDATSASKNYSLKSDAPAVCNNFARKCNQDEVGCELYKSDADNFSVAAKVDSSDLCPQECLGYDVYISRLNSFNSPQKENIIPATATKCDAQAAGCNEFTNLDSLAQGGEAKEYYTELKQCIKPSTDSCSAYYTWEGTTSGYQLKSYSLKKGSDGGPAATSDDSAQCNSIIYHSAISSPDYNSDCQEFYNAAGQVSYHLLAKTITCSDDCHSYRLTEKNVDSSITAAADCVGSDKNWDAVNNDCNVCLSGGVWDANNSACLYQAIPSEGKTCQATENGCREYNGSNGENVRLISASDFESTNSTSNWTSNCTNGLSLSTIANTNNGHSLKYNNSASSCQAIGETAQTTVARLPLIKQIMASDNVAAQLKVGQSVTQGSAYTISFLAQAANATNLKIYFYNKETQAKSYFNAADGVNVSGGNGWQIYRASLDNLDHVVSDNEVLVISANNDFYLDNFVLNEISDRYYLIKGSSQIPDSCSYDNFGVYQGGDYNLGCREYSDRAGGKHDLRQFSNLCSESGVGCEQMIDTKNYAPGGAGIWKDTNNNKQCDSNEPDCVSVPADSAIYAVYDLTKQCNSVDAGCSRLGQATNSGGTNLWADVYKLNNPDNYNTILCGQSAVGCESWTDSSGGSYNFKDPGDNTCVYRAASGSSTSLKNWYYSPVKRCDKNKTGAIEGAEKGTPVCSTDADCGSGNTCLTDNNDYPCSFSSLKTLGLGGNGNQIPTPDQAVGICDAKEAGCTEYIDPVSKFVSNLVYNPDYKITASTNSVKNYEGWASDSQGIASQDITLDAYKLYIFNAELNSGKGDTTLTFTSDVKPLLSDNTLGTSTRQFVIKDGVSQAQLFYSLNNTKATVSGAADSKTIVVKPAVVDYQLQDNLDTKTCNGSVSFDAGCILFNERGIDGNGALTTLQNSFDAYKDNGNSPAPCDPTIDGSCNANKLVKVQPDRICSKWLGCTSYIPGVNSSAPTCYALGECNRLSDDNKECANFVDNPSTSARLFDPNQDKDASGYSLMNRYYFGQMKEVGLNSDLHNDFEELVPTFSVYNLDGSLKDPQTYTLDDYLVREKVTSPTDYPAHGKSYLKVPSGLLVSPQQDYTQLLTNTDYYLNFLVNTHNSNVNAKVYIKYKDSTGNFKDLPTLVGGVLYPVNGGWEREILKFKTNSADSYRVELGTDLTTGGKVYFDDLNIEPVLEVAPNSYVSRECRLYPETSSLTCNDSLAKDGLEGYCLEHDSKNPGVCLTWYPIDHINSAVTGKAMSGYNGIQPLSYCTQVNGNFNLVEKRVGVKLSDVSGGSDNGNYCEKTTQRCALTNNGGILQDDNYVMWISHETNGTWIQGGNTHYTKVFCVPDESKLLIKTNQVTLTDANNKMGNCNGEKYWEGWGIYDGLAIFNNNCPVGQACSNLNEATNIDLDPVRVYDYTKGNNQSESDLIPLNDSDATKNFRLACNSFSQVVDSNGNNMAWSNRISNLSNYTATTPAFFLNTDSVWYGAANANNLDRYGRNSAAVPFGAATIPEGTDLSSGKVYLQNSFSKQNNETTFAGRPYGCSSTNNVSDPGCSIIGSCSTNPDIYCLVDPVSAANNFNISNITCGGAGTCEPLWSKSLNSNSDSENILKTIFLKAYSNYSLSGSSYVAGSNTPYNYSDIGQCNSPTRPGDSDPLSFCSIYPQVKMVGLYLNSNPIASTTPNSFDVTQRGLYELRFTSTIDPEQQPLKELDINWGDSTYQVISGQDSKPSAANPHIIYHYYNVTGPKTIGIKAYDNWGQFNPSVQ